MDIDRLKAELKMLKSLKNVQDPNVITLAEARFSPFIEAATQQLEEIVASVNTTSSLLEATAGAFGEVIDVAAAGKGSDDSSMDQTQKFFKMIADVVSAFKKAAEEIEQWRIEEQRAAEAAQQKAIRRASLAAASSVADDDDDAGGRTDLEQQDNLFGRFKSQQNASPDDIISQLKAKMKLKQLRHDD